MFVGDSVRSSARLSVFFSALFEDLSDSYSEDSVTTVASMFYNDIYLLRKDRTGEYIGIVCEVELADGIGHD